MNKTKKTTSEAVNHQARWLWLTQFRAIVEKEWLIRKRKARLYGLLLFCSCLCVFFVWSFERAFVIYQNIDDAKGDMKKASMFPFSSSIPNCKQNPFIRKDSQCHSLLFAPDTEEFDAVVKDMCRNNQPILDWNLVKGFPSGKMMDEYLYDHPNTVIAAVEFFKESTSKYAFSVQTNGTVRWFKGKFQEPHSYAQIPTMLAVQKALSTRISGKQIDWEVRVGKYPHPVKAPESGANFAPLFYISSMLLLLILQIHEIVDQRERGTVSLLTLAGLRRVPYWLSLITTYSTIYILNAMVLSLVSLVFLFPTFMGLNFIYSFTMLANTSQSIMSLGLLLSSIIRKASSTITVGFSCFLLGWTTMAIISFGFPFSYVGNNAWKVLFLSFPWTVLCRGYEIVSASGDKGMLITLNIILSFQACGFTVLAIYLNACLPDHDGQTSVPWYLIDMRRLYPKEFITRKLRKALKRGESSAEHDNTMKSQEEEMRYLCKEYISDSSQAQESDYVIQMHGLRKEYGNDRRSMPWVKSKKTVALQGNWFGVKKGECFCLLGPNSAGKTTTIKCILGLVQPSEGQAILGGYNISIPQEYRNAQANIGYCPQDNQCLIDLLTMTEHHELFCAMKGCTPTLDQIQTLEYITKDRNKMVRNATAAERRKLSIEIALIGNPQIIVLDEPTAHLDPLTKRSIWKYIEGLRGERSILMATHSMDEAELISDRIGIMVRGKLRCLGSPLELKRRFGSGYKLSLGIRKDRPAERQQVERMLIDLMRKGLDVKTVITSTDYVEFTLPYAKEDRLPLMLTHLNNNKEMLQIRDVQLRPTPLEEVFMTITKKAELENAEIEGRFETLILAEEGIALKIPVGADYIESPGGKFYTVKWTKDRDGRLRIYDYSPDRIEDIG